ncbi:MAG TPA: hypothetical protein VEN28_06520 [Burkholderiaceae bacterium]|nr:hypothetical protein [Burkholderiaceae bacterium]
MNALAARGIHAAAVALALAFGTAAHAASAVAACRVTTYYADAEMTIKVGTTTTCPGSRENGRMVKVTDIDVFEAGSVRREPSLPAGTLPCEFQADCKPTSVEAPAETKHPR